MATADLPLDPTETPRGPREPAADPAAPPLAGRFDLGEPLGSGGMATVYRAWDRAREVTCAVKVLDGLLSRDDEFRRRFRREAAAAMSLAHERIVRVDDCGDDGPRQFIVMEYVPGGTLHDRVRRDGALPEADALRIAAEVADALAYAHSRGVVHRDIKPHNVLLTADGHVKVADFGIARTLDGTHLTRTGSLVGSAHYLAPEQARGDPAGPAVDQYALGVVLFEVLVGRVPFDGDAPVAIALKHMHEPLPDLAAARGGLSPATVEIVRRLLEKAPEARFPSAGAAADALRRAAAAAPDDTAVLGTVPAAAPARADDGATGRLAPSGALRTATIPVGRDARPASDGGDTAVHSGAMSDTGSAAAPPQRRSRRGAWARVTIGVGIGVCVAVMAAAGYRGAWLAAHAAVPSLAGRTVQDAGQDVLPLQLGVIVTSQRQDPHAPVGVILAQDPPAGSEVVKGSVIQLTVSQGSGVVPDLGGQPASRAARLLESAGLRLGAVSYSHDDRVPAGDVIAQIQPAGTHLDPNGGVDVLVSTGPPLAPAKTTSPVAPDTTTPGGPTPSDNGDGNQ